MFSPLSMKPSNVVSTRRRTRSRTVCGWLAVVPMPLRPPPMPGPSKHGAEIHDVLSELNLAFALADALWQLDPAASEPSMRQLAAQLRCDPATETFLADRLEQLGYATRAVAVGDRRTKMLQLTDAGRPARRRLVDAATTRTPIPRLTDAEQRCLHSLMTKAMAPPA